MVQWVEPALHQQGPLQPKRTNKEVEAHSTKAVALQKSHEEAKPHKDHDVYILETCSTNKRGEGKKVEILQKSKVLIKG